VIDIIHNTIAVTDINKLSQYVGDIFIGKNPFASNLITAQTLVELHTSNTRQVIAIFVKEEAIKQILRGLFCWRLTGTHHAIDLHLRFQDAGCCIDTQSSGDKWAMVQVVGE